MNARNILQLESTATPVCGVDAENGQVCSAPATAFDHQRGRMVCERHRPAISLAEQVLGPLEPEQEQTEGTERNNLGGSGIASITSAEEPAAAPKPAVVQADSGVRGGGLNQRGHEPEREEETIEFKQGDVSLVIYASGPWRETGIGAAIVQELQSIAKKLGVEL